MRRNTRLDGPCACRVVVVFGAIHISDCWVMLHVHKDMYHDVGTATLYVNLCFSRAPRPYLSCPCPMGSRRWCPLSLVSWGSYPRPAQTPNSKCVRSGSLVMHVFVRALANVGVTHFRTLCRVWLHRPVYVRMSASLVRLLRPKDDNVGMTLWNHARQALHNIAIVLYRCGSVAQSTTAFRLVPHFADQAGLRHAIEPQIVRASVELWEDSGCCAHVCVHRAKKSM